MPDLEHSLGGHDLGHLKIVAELWGVELEARDARSGAPRLAKALLDAQLLHEIVEALPGEAQTALEELIEENGRLAWAQFTRRHGEVREMGPGRRERERPHLNPASTAEILWYRALVGRAFFDTPGGPEEFVYIPNDLLALMPYPGEKPGTSLGRPATPTERAYPLPVNDHLLDAACTLLAALRLGLDEAEIERHGATCPTSLEELKALLATAGVLDGQGQPEPELTRAFLEAERGRALAQLARSWLESKTYNDLRMLPHLQAEGEWENDPLATRRTMLGFLEDLPQDTWWSLTAFVTEVHQKHPDFQRPAGDYDSWYLRDAQSGDYLRGFEHWEAVEGELLRHIIRGPLHWLGFYELAASEEDAEPGAFRRSIWGAALLAGEAPDGLAVEDGKLHIDSQARLRVPRLLPRAARYQIARFCEWEDEGIEEYRYRITPASLKRAREQSLKESQLLGLLKRHTAAPLPPSLIKALEKWEKHGTQARLENVLVLRLNSPETLEALRASRAARFLGDPLGPTTVVVKPGAWKKLMEALAEMGYLGDAEGVEE